MNKITDDEAKWLYAALIGMSWAHPDTFDVCQKAWEYFAAAEDIETIERNGHGRVIRRSVNGGLLNDR